MHIISGLLLAGLFKKSRVGHSFCGIPMYRTGPIRVAHALPGRIRFLVPTLKGSQTEQVAALSSLKNVSGIDEVKTNPITGSVVVEYQADALEPILIFSAIARLLGLEEALEKTTPPKVTQELNSVVNSVNHAVFDRTFGTLDLRSATALALLIVGGVKVARDGWASFPAGFTLFWWGLHALPKGNECSR